MMMPWSRDKSESNLFLNYEASFDGFYSGLFIKARDRENAASSILN